MSTVLIAFGSFVGFIIAYHTYGRWIAKRIFKLDDKTTVPSKAYRDDKDFLPTKKEVIFGHHFTSIAGTGPIVGPAIAVFWGWLPALLWVVFGSIFIGAVHDFGALVVSLRNEGKSIGDVAGKVICPRARILFLIILFFTLAVVLGVFGLVIAVIFSLYPESVFSVWIEIPIAVVVGFWVYRKGGGILISSLIALGLLYLGIVIGAYLLPIDLTAIEGVSLFSTHDEFASAVVIWTVILFIYCFIASVLPVWTLLQPRDFINSHQLMLALGLLLLGLLVAGFTGEANLIESAPAIAQNIPKDAPPIWPFLFITIACGACSGFHSLVSSGTSSKQLASETDAQYVGYGSMLLEAALAVIVILACCAGVGMGKYDRTPDENSITKYQYSMHIEADTGQHLIKHDAWKARYDPEKEWSAFGLGTKIGAFIEGGGNFLSAIGIPLKLAIAIMAVLVASFAATTLDTATRLQRYVIQELASVTNIKPLAGKYTATAVAVIVGGIVALMPGPKGFGSGGLILWPLFGATNQLLAGLALMVIVFYLWRRNLPVYIALIPMIFMIMVPGWAMIYNIFMDFLPNEKWLLFGFGLVLLGLQAWIIAEALIMFPRAKGVIEKELMGNDDSGNNRVE